MNCPFCQQLITIQDFKEHHKVPQRQACFYGCSYMYLHPKDNIVEYHIMQSVNGINYRLYGYNDTSHYYNWKKGTYLDKLPEITFTVKQDKMFYVADLLSVEGREVFHTPSFVKLSTQEEFDGLIPRLLKLRAFS